MKTITIDITYDDISGKILKVQHNGEEIVEGLTGIGTAVYGIAEGDEYRFFVLEDSIYDEEEE